MNMSNMSVSVQVYVRRAYTAYEVISVQQDELADDVTIVEWQFLLPQSHPNRLHVLHITCRT